MATEDVMVKVRADVQQFAKRMQEVLDTARPVVQRLANQLADMFGHKRVDGTMRHAALLRARAWEQVPPNAKAQQARAAQIERIRSGARWHKTTGDREREIARLQAKRRAK